MASSIPLFLAVTLILTLLLHRAGVIVYRLYFHPLSKFPGPRLAAFTTLYRAYYQVWKNGDMLRKAIDLHKQYGNPDVRALIPRCPYSLQEIGPCVRVSPNELEFCNSAAYFDIYSNQFNGTKDPDHYQYLRFRARTYFDMTDVAEHRVRSRQVASLFTKKHFDTCEPRMKKNAERFNEILSLRARDGRPCHLSMGYRALTTQIINDFIFSDIPKHFDCLVDEDFSHPLSFITHGILNWTMWFTRNFPQLQAFLDSLLRPVVAIIADPFLPRLDETKTMRAHVRYERDPKTPKRSESVMQQFIQANSGDKVEKGEVSLDNILVAEATVTMLAGAVDPTNILSYGTFMLTQDPQFQQDLYEELKSVWSDRRAPMPSFEVLKSLPLLNALIKESMRLTHGIITGPPRLVGAGGTVIDGYHIPAGCTVSCSSYYSHMDEAVFPDPEVFDHSRWLSKDNSASIVLFSRGRRRCPAEQFANMQVFFAFATVLRNYRTTVYETTEADFQYNQYFSIVFQGRPLRAILKERVN